MMIHINLLPVRQVKKREMGRQFIVAAVLVVAAAGIGNYLWYSSRQAVADQNAQRISETNRKINELQKVIGEVDNINQREKEVQAKLDVLNDLRKRRSGPVRMMDALATATPKKVWLTNFDEKSNAVKIDGSAFSHEDVADFMRNLEDIVWTPKGIGRLIDQKRGAQSSRVELLASDGVIEEFPVAEISPFFTQIDLKNAAQHDPSGKDGIPLVTFSITLNANYAI